MQRLRESIHTALAHVSKGWFNLEETSFEVYSVSKLKKLMELVKFAMQVYTYTLYCRWTVRIYQILEEAAIRNNTYISC